VRPSAPKPRYRPSPRSRPHDDPPGSGPCHRGLHNPAYYRLDPADPRHYLDTTGTGNSLNAGSPVSLQLIMDSLRYWLTVMGVDGFRFDLAPTLARQEGGFDQLSAFFDLVSQDPMVSQAKLIAEPWDVGRADSYDLGRFPPLWSEWNGRYRDVMRDFWFDWSAVDEQLEGSSRYRAADPAGSAGSPVRAHDGRLARCRLLDAALSQFTLELGERGQCRQWVVSPLETGNVHEGDVIGEPVRRVPEAGRPGFGECREDLFDQARVHLGRVGAGLVADDDGLVHLRISHRCIHPRFLSGVAQRT
jgi:hypothetical protein